MDTVLLRERKKDKEECFYSLNCIIVLDKMLANNKSLDASQFERVSLHQSEED